MAGLNVIQWTSLVPFIFWWLYPLTSTAIFESFAYATKGDRASRRKKKDDKKKMKLQSPPPRRGIFRMYKYLRYTYIRKPSIWIFLIGWAIVYLLIGISSWMYANWAEDKRNIFDIQFELLWCNFIFNVLWIPLFFIFHKPYIALLDMMLVLITAIAAAILRFIDAGDSVGRHPSVWVSSGLFVIYPIWMAYITALFADIIYTMKDADFSRLGRRKRQSDQTR